METDRTQSFWDRFAISKHLENVKKAVEELETMEMGEEKLEAYKRVDCLIKDSIGKALKAFLWRSLVFMAVFVLFLVTISCVKSNWVQIAVGIVTALCFMFLISPMFPSPFGIYQSKLKQMMKKDGVKSADLKR